MPISIEHKLVFIHLAKTGGSSIGTGLHGAGISFQIDGRDVWSRLTLHPQGTRLIRRLKAIYPLHTVTGFWENHLPAALLQAFVPEGLWSHSFKFAFVRNPWDLVVSTYFFAKSRQARLDVVEPDFAKVLAACDFPQFVHAYPLLFSDMSAMLEDDSGAMAMDFVGRFERLEEDFERVCARVGVSGRLPHVNGTPHAHYRQYYDNSTRTVVERHFARDIECFGYRF